MTAVTAGAIKRDVPSLRTRQRVCITRHFASQLAAERISRIIEIVSMFDSMRHFKT